MVNPDQFENKRGQLVESLNTVAEALRNCATVADQFAQILAEAPEKPTVTSKRKAKTVEADGDGKKKRRVKKPRDPNEPKRPASSYIMFQNDVRKELKSQNPNVSQSDLLHMIAKQWSEMSEEQKSIYSQANASAKERYSAEKAAYIATKNPVAEMPAATPVPPEKKSVKTPKAAPKAAPKSAQVIASSSSGSGSDESSEDEEEGDDDEEEEEEDRPVLKRAKTTSSPIATREKKQK